MSQYSLDALRQRYVVEKRPLEASVEQILRADTRAGIRAILASIDKRRFENRSEGQRLRRILGFGTSLWESGHQAVAGVDEAGMSPLAGPVSAGAVILKPGTRIIGRRRSRKRLRVGVWRSSRSRISTPSISIGQASRQCNVR